MTHFALTLGATVIYLAVLAGAVLFGRYVARCTNRFWLGIVAWAVMFYGIAAALAHYGLPVPFIDSTIGT